MTDSSEKSISSKDKDKQNVKSNEKPVKTSKSNEFTKKSFRIVVRKLPVRQFTMEDFVNCVNKVCSEINVTRESFTIEHFIEGKIRFQYNRLSIDILMWMCFIFSRKRGPVFGAGFINVTDEQQFRTFLELCPSKCSFIEGFFT